MQIVPAIETPSLSDFSTLLDRFASFAPLIQVDFNDGSFQNFKTVLPGEVVSQCRVFSDDLFLEAHLMVADPEAHVEDLVKAGFRRVVIQMEIEKDIRTILENLAVYDVELGLALSPETPIEEVEPFGDLIQVINVMLVSPGVQGQKMIPEILQKVRDLKNGNYPGIIEVDGGVDRQTLLTVKEFEPDVVIGGSIFKSGEHPEEIYQQMLDIVG